MMVRLKLLIAGVATSAVVFAATSPGYAQVRPGPQDVVTVCHKPGTAAEKTLTLPRKAPEAHIRAHGDTEGPCVLVPEPSACPSIAVDVRLVNGFSLPGRPYDEGDMLVVTVGFPAGSPPPTTIELFVQREVVPGSPVVIRADFPSTLSFTFPATGIYFVQVTVDGGANASFTARCVPNEA
jgi:hypothetical protein